MNDKHISDCYKYSEIQWFDLTISYRKWSCVFAFRGKWKQKTLILQKHREYSFFIAKHHALFIFASLVLSTMIPTWEITNEWNLKVTALRKVNGIPMIGIFRTVDWPMSLLFHWFLILASYWNHLGTLKKIPSPTGKIGGQSINSFEK